MAKGEGSGRKSACTSPLTACSRSCQVGEGGLHCGSQEGKAEGITELLSNPEPCLKTCHDKAAGEHRPGGHTTLESVKSWPYHSLELGQSA